MSHVDLSPELLTLLQSVDTPTVCNAIEVVQGTRGFNRFTRGTMQHSRPGAPAMVGRATTARIAGVAPPTEAADVIKARRLDYYRAMAQGPFPRVAVIEDLDYPNAIAGWWGEVNVAVHKGLGLSGAVTNGVMRDLDVVDPGFPVLAGSIGVSHGFVHVVEIGTEVSVMDLRVAPGEMIHADRHGALVIPEEVIPALGEAIDTVVRNEQIILGPAKQSDFNIDKLLDAWAEFERRRT